jgi:hypothetical protein
MRCILDEVRSSAVSQAIHCIVMLTNRLVSKHQAFVDDTK